MAISSSVKRFWVLRGSSQLKAGPFAEAKLRVAHALMGAMARELLVHVLRIGRNIVSWWSGDWEDKRTQEETVVFEDVKDEFD